MSSQNKKNEFSDKIARSLFWVTCGKGTQALLQFSVLLILARLISPLDFGVLSAAMIVIGFSDIVTELGLEAAIVQRKKLEERHIATAFTTSCLITCLAGLVIYLLAPYIAGFFNSSKVEEVLRVLAWLFPIRGLATVGEGLIQREMAFRWVALRDAISLGVGYFVFGCGMALLGYGIWALVAATMVSSAIKTGFLLKKFPPRNFRPERKALSELLFFGGGHTLARISNNLALQGDNLVVGRTLDLVSLGLYGRAYQLMSVPASIIGQILDRVLFPSMSKIQGQKDRLAEAYLRGVSLVSLLMLPGSVVGIILAPELVYVLLGDKWVEVVLPFRILLIGLMMRTSYKLSDSLSRATGAVYQRAWRQAVYAGLVVVGAWIGHFWGVAGVAIGVLIVVIINFLLMAQLSLKLIGADWHKFLAVHRTPACTAFILGALTFPWVYFLREMMLAPILVLVAAVSWILLAALIGLRFAPAFFLGSEGIWLITILQRYLPQRFQALFEIQEKAISPIHGVKDASIENA